MGINLYIFFFYQHLFQNLHNLIIYIGEHVQLVNRLLISTAVIERIYTVLDTKLVLDKDKDLYICSLLL